MIIGKNYATGSSRVTGVTRPLAAWGVRVYIGESFGPIFLTNAVQYGVLTVELPRETLNEIEPHLPAARAMRERDEQERPWIYRSGDPQR